MAGKTRTQRPREDRAQRTAQGRARVLAVGIDDYSQDCGFDARSTGRNDALTFADCFRDVPQLGADPGAITTLVSRGSARPSRGAILGALTRLAQSTVDGDRLIFYFSGHGHRIPDDPEFYLVPEDAYSDVDPTSLIPFSRIRDLIHSATATQKIVLLDACLSGSRAFLDEYMRRTTGLVVLCSAEDARSTAPSPNPQHSLFTTYLLQALRGADPGALEGRLLTVSSLHRYLSAEVARWAHSAHCDRRPLLHGSGSVVLADFSGPLLSPDAFAPAGGPLHRLTLSTRGRPVALKDILTALKRSYTQAYLEQKANDALGERLAEALGAKVPELRRRFKWSSADVHVEGSAIAFPDGRYDTRYVASSDRQGALVEELSLQPVWLARPGHVAALLEVLDLDPERVTFFFREALKLADHLPKLEAHGWQMTSELAHQLRAFRQGCALALEPDSLSLEGLPLRQLFAEEPDTHAVRTARSALAILGGA